MNSVKLVENYWCLGVHNDKQAIYLHCFLKLTILTRLIILML